MPNGQSVCQIPCALRSHLQIDSGGRHLQLANLSQQECEVIFLHWVVTERNRLPYLSPIESLTCPVLWCGINFDNGESLLCHLKDCPHLSASDYWCPRCHRAESFASYKIPVPRPSRQTPVQKRPSRLKKLLHKHLYRKSVSDRSQDPTMKPKHDQDEFGSFSNYFYSLWELYGQNIHEHCVPNELSSKRGAHVERWGQQNNTSGSSDTLIPNCEPFEMNSCMESVEKDGFQISELDGYRTSQLNELSDQVPDLSTQDIQALIQTRRSNLASFESAGQSQIGGRNPATGIVDQQHIPSVDYREPLPTYSGYDLSLALNRAGHTPNVYPLRHTQNRAYSEIEPTINAINFQVHGQKVRQSQPNPATVPVNSLVTASYNKTCSGSMGTVLSPETSISGAELSTRLPMRYSHGPSNTSNWPGFQNSWPSQAGPNHVPRSTTSAYGLPTQTLAHNSIQTTINTINVPVGGQRARHGHPYQGTGPVHSPQSASSNQTNTTWSKDSMVTAQTPVTSFSDSVSPTGLSPGNPQQNEFTCKKCSVHFSDRSNLRRHEKHSHGKVAPTPCRAGCGKEYERSDNEGRHYAKQCEMERSWSDQKGRKARSFGIHLAYSQKNHPGCRGTDFSAVRVKCELSTIALPGAGLLPQS